MNSDLSQHASDNLGAAFDGTACRPLQVGRAPQNAPSTGVSLSIDLDQARGTAIDVSIILPALNEAENLPLLFPRLARALEGHSYEVIVVDDGSTDSTLEVHARLAEEFPTELIVRNEPTAGLSGAILEGMARARGRYLAVMDADLQHPPESLPDLLAPLDRDEADFVIGSRYVAGGSTEGSWGFGRRFNSWVATQLARPVAGKTADPMSGFFVLRRESYDAAERLTPQGYKIGLELICKCRTRRVREVPIHFGLRARGQSKLNLRQQFKYLEHLSRLYDYAFPRSIPPIKFLIVLAVSWVVGLSVWMAMLAHRIGGPASLAAAYVAALAATATFHLRYIRTQRQFVARPRPWIDFAFIALPEFISCTCLALWLAWRAPLTRPLEAFVICFGCAAVARFVLRKELLHDIRGLRRNVNR